MNKNFKRIILGVFMAAMVMFAFAKTSDAAQAYPVKKLSEDKWATHPGTGYVDYKFKAEETGYVKVTLKDTEGYTYADMFLLNSSKEYIFNSCYLDSTNKSETMKWAVKEGSTYYIRVYDYTNQWDNYTGDAAKVKWSLTKISSKSNYAKSKASTLEKDKTVTVVQTRDKCYDRWYKIKLTKKQAIKYWFKDTEFGNSAPFVKVYDSKLKPITFITDDSSTGKMISSSTCAKGTYYVRISYDDWYFDDLYQERAMMCTFKWK